MLWLSNNKLNLVYFCCFLSRLFCFLLQIDVCFLPFNQRHPCCFHTFVPVRIITIIYIICAPLTIASNYMIGPFRAPFCVLSVIATWKCTFTRWIHTWLWVTYIELVLINLCWWVTSYEKESKYISIKYVDRINLHWINFDRLRRICG